MADGYARNFLFPRKLALAVTDENKRQIERERAKAEAREAEEVQVAQALASRLETVELAIARRVGENETLYGSVTAADIAEALAARELAVDRRKIQLAEPLKTLGERYGFAVDAVGPVTADGAQVSSTVVRKLLAAGDVRRVARLLGRAHVLRGRVVTGEQRGRTLGFPTANLHLPPDVMLPADGVYAVWATAGARRVRAVLNVGVRPTFGELRRTSTATS